MRLECALICLCMIVGSGLGIADEALTVNGFSENGKTMVALGDVLRFIGCEITWSPDTDRISIAGQQGSLTFTPGEGNATYRPAGGQEAARTLPARPRYAGYLLHGPLEAICEAMGLACDRAEENPDLLRFEVNGKVIKVRLRSEAEKIALDLARGSLVKLQTARGDIYLDLFDIIVPITAGNFLDLVMSGFYDGLTFHRVMADFMIQGGDPNGDGTGSPGWTIPDEADKGLKHYRGTLSMAKLPDPDTGGSQFFICHLPQPHLDGIHSVFGRCVMGMDVVDSVRAGDKIIKATVLRESENSQRAIMAARMARVPDKAAPEGAEGE